MKAIERHVARFNALAPRERIAVSAAVLMLIGFCGYAFSIAPQRASAAAARAQAVQTEADLAILRRELQALGARTSDPDAPLRTRLDEVREEMGRVDARLSGLQGKLVPPQRVSALLQDMIGRQRELRLVSLRTLPAAGLLQKDAPAATQPGVPQAQGAGPSGAEAGIYRHGVELTVQGSYVALVAYLDELERLPQQLYWSEASLTADYPVATLKLIVYTISLERTWLTV